MWVKSLKHVKVDVFGEEDENRIYLLYVFGELEVKK
jgi:hypothetical protein